MRNQTQRAAPPANNECVYLFRGLYAITDRRPAPMGTLTGAHQLRLPGVSAMAPAAGTVASPLEDAMAARGEAGTPHEVTETAGMAATQPAT